MEPGPNDSESFQVAIDSVPFELSELSEPADSIYSSSGSSGSHESDGLSITTDSSEECTGSSSMEDLSVEHEPSELTKFMKSAACAMILPLNDEVLESEQAAPDMKRISARVFVRRRELMPESALFHSIRTLTASVVSVCFYGTLAQAKAMARKTPRIFFHAFSYQQAVANPSLSMDEVLLLVKIRQANDQAYFGYATGAILTPKALLYRSSPGLRQAYLESLPDYIATTPTEEPLYCCVWEYSLSAIGTTVRNLGGSRSVTIDLDAVYKTAMGMQAVAAEFGVRLDVQPGHSTRDGKPKKRRFRSFSAAPQSRKKRLEDPADFDAAPNAPKSPKEKKAQTMKKNAAPRVKRTPSSSQAKRPPRVRSLKLTMDGLVPDTSAQTDFSWNGFSNPPTKSFANQEDRHYMMAYRPPYYPDHSWERRLAVPKYLPQGYFVPVYAPMTTGYAPLRATVPYGVGANMPSYGPSTEGSVPAQVRDESEPSRCTFVDLPPVALTLPHAPPSLYMSHQMYSSECEHSTSAQFSSSSFSASCPPPSVFDTDLTPTSPLDEMDSLSFETESALWASSEPPSSFSPFPSSDTPGWSASSSAPPLLPPQPATPQPSFNAPPYANAHAPYESTPDFW